MFLGYKAGLENTEGRSNIFIGQRAGESNLGEEDHTSGNENIFIGDRSGLNNTEGYSNVYVGTSAGHHNENGSFNVFVGDAAGLNVGHDVGDATWVSSSNTIIGNNAAAQADALKSGNVFVGLRSGYYSEGSRNVYIGERAGYNGNGSNNVFLGYKAGRDQSGSGCPTETPCLPGKGSSHRVNAAGIR